MNRITESIKNGHGGLLILLFLVAGIGWLAFGKSDVAAVLAVGFLLLAVGRVA